jgi:hypothetical protein
MMLPAANVRAKRFLFMMLTFFVLNMPISNSFISIKAAAFLFALFGCLRAWENRQRSNGLQPGAAIRKIGALAKSAVANAAPVALKQGG